MNTRSLAQQRNNHTGDHKSSYLRMQDFGIKYILTFGFHLRTSNFNKTFYEHLLAYAGKFIEYYEYIICFSRLIMTEANFVQKQDQNRVVRF